VGWLAVIIYCVRSLMWHFAGRLWYILLHFNGHFPIVSSVFHMFEKRTFGCKWLRFLHPRCSFCYPKKHWRKLSILTKTRKNHSLFLSFLCLPWDSFTTSSTMPISLPLSVPFECWFCNQCCTVWVWDSVRKNYNWLHHTLLTRASQLLISRHRQQC